MTMPTRVNVDNAPILPFALTAGVVNAKPGMGVKLVGSASWATPGRPEVDICALNTDVCVGTIRGSLDPVMNTLFQAADVVSVALFAPYAHEVKAGAGAIVAGTRVCAGTGGLFVTAPAFSAAGAGGLCVSPGIALDDAAAGGGFGLLVCPETYPC